MENTFRSINATRLAILVSTLGYFVDAFDLVLFSVVRTESIIDLKLVEASDKGKLLTIGVSLENWQALGLLVGGILFGILADYQRIGRVKMLYFSIALYSIANLLNGLLSPTTPFLLEIYKLLRFSSGLGLAGELGISVTLVSELMSKDNRGIGTMWIAFIGLLGCVAAAYMAEFTTITWQNLFLFGGSAGVLLLLFRLNITESTIFESQGKSSIKQGSFFSIFTNRDRLYRFASCILVGLPVYFVIGLPIKFSTNFGSAFGINEKISVPMAIMMCYIFLAIGDVVCNTLSQIIKSRKKLLYFFNFLNLISILCFILLPPQTANQYLYIYCPLLGFSVGYWALIVTNAAESFGTNLRSTVATSTPNLIRASFIPISMAFLWLESKTDTITSAATIGLGCSVIAIIATFFTKENFGKDLNFIEK